MKTYVEVEVGLQKLKIKDSGPVRFNPRGTSAETY
jgi:hypothetical protein